jgi:hypothetical protein
MTLLRSSGAVGIFAGLVLLVACSGDDKKPAQGCQDSQCAANNKCINDGTATECRLVCSKQTDCPAKYNCVATPTGDVTYCAPETGYAAQIQPKASGQWGASCKPEGGFDTNPDCDTDQSFWCYGQNPTDAESFCTQFQCGSDLECKGGYWCATVNVEPSVRRARRTVKQTQTVCLPRRYCSPCKNNVDCPKGADGNPQFCVAGSDDAKFCTSECNTDNNCQGDAVCVDDGDHRVCKPKAGTCKGDGSFCSPCRSDDDCQGDSICLRSAYSKEQFCVPKSGKACAVVNDKVVSDCPDTPKADGLDLLGVGCMTERDSPDIPKDYCVPYIQYSSDEQNVIEGCWTRKQK